MRSRPPSPPIDWGALGEKLVHAIAFGLGWAWGTLKYWWENAWPKLIDIVKNLTWKDVGMYIADQLTFGLASKLGSFGDIIKRAAGAAKSGMAEGQAVAGKRARGGPVGAGKLYLVGENGPELFRAPSSGSILPNSMFRLAAGASLAAAAPMAAAAASPAGGAPGGGHYVVNIYPQPGQDPQAIAQAVRAELDRRDREQVARRNSSYEDLD